MYVAMDGILIFTENDMERKIIKNALNKGFEIQNLAEAKFTHGLEITRDRKNGKLWIDQEQYIKDIIKPFNMDNCNTVKAPIDVNQKLSQELCPNLDEEILYMQSVSYQEAI